MGSNGAVLVSSLVGAGRVFVLRCAVININVNALTRAMSIKPKGIKGFAFKSPIRLDMIPRFSTSGVGDGSGESSDTVGSGVSDADVVGSSVGVAV